MKTAISLSDQLFRQGEEFAQRLGMGRSELYAKALDEYLKRHEARHITAVLDDLYAEEDSALSPGLAELGFVSLRRG